ncbi:uroporphyrinogen-III synthase [Halobacillus sp. ACCC02827]|uniref:uroporphyrinogen-III synthase n=1 Tax=Halobacillus sp. ACCC02827 TaxID=3052090 RepID=UPI002570F2BE|nr:uroporphyrinogen-III synthase [Halobacillus sp. ACCC02827]WJE14548.1 uroporphyrinogen-III synthase [Halobacillus sp. ACCC02827]
MKPLEGKGILVTRGKSQAQRFIKHIEKQGGVAYHAPLLTFQLKDTKSSSHLLHELHDYSWVFMTSSNGVKFFFELLRKHGRTVPPELRFAIVGKKTEQQLKQFGYKADFVPTEYRAEVMGGEFLEAFPEPGKILYIRGNLSRDVLPAYFKAEQVFFHSMTVYDTLLVDDHKRHIAAWLEEGRLDALTFTSPSTVKAFHTAVSDSENKGRKLPCFCIGPTTADAAARFGFTNICIPENYTIESMIERIVQYFSSEGKR